MVIDLSQFAAVLSGLRSGTELLKGLIKLSTDTQLQTQAFEFGEKIIAAQQFILEAQQAQSSLVQEISALKGQIAAMKNWDAEKARYQLATPFRGATVYAVQKSMSNGEPPHYLCANCFKQGKPSILQLGSEPKTGDTFFGCPVCKSQARTGYRGQASAKYAEDIPAASG